MNTFRSTLVSVIFDHVALLISDHGAHPASPCGMLQTRIAAEIAGFSLARRRDRAVLFEPEYEPPAAEEQRQSRQTMRAVYASDG
jgi:hypothetical protein